MGISVKYRGRPLARQGRTRECQLVTSRLGGREEFRVIYLNDITSVSYICTQPAW